MGQSSSTSYGSAEVAQQDPRTGHYYFGRLVVRQGETASIFDSSGNQEIVQGPAARRPFFCDVSFLTQCACDEQRYLIIEYLNGKREHVRGPTSLFVDPCVHKSVNIESAILLEASELLVVYTENSGEGSGGSRNVTRRIVRGPEIFIPMANEWLHRFSWHGTVIPGKAKGSITGQPDDVKTAHAVEFTKLRQLPDQMYYTVRDLRTSDDALLTLHIMVFFELVDIEKMLDETNDPISDIINAANADVMTFGACRTYEQLLAESSELSENSSFPLLATRLKTIGYTLNKVVYRGYQTSGKLQAMQESAISSRTKLRLEADTQRHEQENQTAQLIANEKQAVHKFSQESKEAEHVARMKQLKVDQELAADRQRNEIALTHMRDMNSERKEFLKSLADMGVDLTKYLCAEVGSKPTSHLLIENTGPMGTSADGKNLPQLHLH